MLRSLIVAGGALLVLAGCATAVEDVEQDISKAVAPKEQPFWPGARANDQFSWWDVSQGWDDETRMAFWFTSQGSRLIPYDWFLALEVPDGTALLRGEENIRKLGYIPAPVIPKWNPDGLPIGLVGGDVDTSGREWMGPTCALCHTSFIKDQNGVELLVDGGQTLGDFQGMLDQIVDALIETWSNPAKMRRFADKVIGADAAPTRYKALENELSEWTMVLAEINEVNTVGAEEYGHGRVDAVGAIFNMVTTRDLKAPENAAPANAPVSYPFLWGTPQSDVVQWPGFAPNGRFGAGPLLRNIGEVIGVFGRVDVDPRDKKHYLKADSAINNPDVRSSLFGYPSSINITNLGKIENSLHQLRSPAWPDNLFDAPEPRAVARGAAIYAAKCAQCHQVQTRAQQAEPYQAVMVPQVDIGTDPQEVINFLAPLNPVTGRKWQTGLFEGSRKFVVAGPKFGPTVDARADLLVTMGLGVALAKPGSSLWSAVRSFEKVDLAPKFPPASYKARPLTGIWATAPYLHNGSVPTLYDLLLPPAERPKTFRLGDHTLDERKVGYVNAGDFVFDTRLKGNSNGGHLYGTDMSEAERWDVVEFMKTL